MSEKYLGRLALTIGGASLALTPGAVNAGFTTVVPGSPLTVSLLEGTHFPPDAASQWLDEVNWDIDGDTTIDFKLTAFAAGSRGTYTSGVKFDHRTQGEIGIKKYSFSNSGGLTFRASSRQFYGSGSTGSILAATAKVYRKFSTGGATTVKTTIFSSINGSAAPTGTATTSNFTIAFSFNSGSGQQVGWAAASLDTTTWTLSINEWTYGDPSEKTIHVGTRGDEPVPEPSSTLPAIALLAAGAAGVRAWRKSRKSDAKAA